MHDGSRHFGDLPENYSVEDPEWHRLREHVRLLPGARITGFLTDDVTEAWIDFTYQGHRFSINNQLDDWWFFVDDPRCPDAILDRVLAHFATLLAPRDQ